MRWLVLTVVGWSSASLAYGFMLRHEYTTCAQCHVDPSGGSVVTPYGRAQGELILRSRYGVPAEEPGPMADFLFGLFKVPEPLQLSGDVRGAFASSTSSSGLRAFPMQADLTAAISADHFAGSLSLGAGSQASQAATLSGDGALRFVSRHHWVGYVPDEDRAWLIRFGRMNLPFGLRLPEHPALVRRITRTDVSVSQQHGLAVSYSGEHLRAEVMGIVGNLQLEPRDFRERGYSASVEWSLTPSFVLGASSLVTHAERDVLEPTRAVFHHAHGLSARLVPVRPLVLSMEADFTWDSRRGTGGSPGGVGLLHADLELTQGFHLVGLGEVLLRADGSSTYGGWGGLWWFLGPHVDLRIDVMTRAETSAPTEPAHVNTTLLGQLHFFL